MKKILFCVVLLLAACHKDNGPASTPANKTGNITGTISPAAAATTVTAYNVESQHNYVTQPTVNGMFTLDNLPVGNYNISILKSPGFTSARASSFNVNVNKDSTLNMGTILFYNDADPGSPNYISYTVNGTKTLRGTTVGASYTSPTLLIYTYTQALVTAWTGNIVNDIVDRLDIILDNVTGPGTYICKGTPESTIRLSRKFVGMGTTGPLNIWSTVNTGGNATVTITSVDPVTRTLSGTFTASLRPEIPVSPGNTANQVITDGVFANYRY